jgi:hypothetical protein
MPKITKRLVEAAEVREKDYIICDDELRGFAVRVLPSGKRYYIVQYRIGTRYRRMSPWPAPHGALPLTFRGDVAGDRDPVPRRHGDGQRVAAAIATAGAVELPLHVEQFGVPRSAVLQ